MLGVYILFILMILIIYSHNMSVLSIFLLQLSMTNQYMVNVHSLALRFIIEW